MPDHHLHTALHAQPDHCLRPYPHVHQVLRQLVCPAVQLPVAQALFLIDNRHGLRRAPRLRCKQLVHAPPWILALRPVPLLHHQLPLRFPQQLQLSDTLLGLLDRTLQQLHQTPAYTLDRPSLEHIGRVLDATPSGPFGVSIASMIVRSNFAAYMLDPGSDVNLQTRQLQLLLAARFAAQTST